MHWVYLLVAIALEVGGTTCMKLSDGFSKVVPSVLAFVLYASCLALLTLAFEKLPVSVAYTVWGSVGTVLIVLIGMLFFDERLSAVQAVSILLVVLGVIGINLGRTDDEVSARPTPAQPAVSAPTE